VVHALHHPPEEILRSAYRRYWRLWKNAPLVADGILTVSRHTQDHIQALYGKDSYIVGNGLERDILNTPKDLSLRESLGWKPDQPVLVYVGSLTRRKGLEVLFEAFAGLKKRYPEALLAIVGGGYQPYFRSLATGFGLGEDIHWAGPVSRKRLIQYLDAATVFCFPSHSEGFGIPPLEAMARGVPVVLTDSGGVREYVRPAENCLMVATGDSGAFQIALEKILDQAALAQSLARQGQACAARFTWETVAEKTELAFEEILQKS
jgi:glycosyltransferase involved in cell wall biosynthesis